MMYITVSSYASKGTISWHRKIKTRIIAEEFSEENEVETEWSAQEISNTEMFLLSLSARKGDLSHLQVGKQWLPQEEYPKRAGWGIECVIQK